jgi:hypothetical protein
MLIRLHASRWTVLRTYASAWSNAVSYFDFAASKLELELE